MRHGLQSPTALNHGLLTTENHACAPTKQVGARNGVGPVCPLVDTRINGLGDAGSPRHKIHCTNALRTSSIRIARGPVASTRTPACASHLLGSVEREPSSPFWQAVQSTLRRCLLQLRLPGITISTNNPATDTDRGSKSRRASGQATWWHNRRADCLGGLRRISVPASGRAASCPSIPLLISAKGAPVTLDRPTRDQNQDKERIHAAGTACPGSGCLRAAPVLVSTGTRMNASLSIHPEPTFTARRDGSAIPLHPRRGSGRCLRSRYFGRSRVSRPSPAGPHLTRLHVLGRSPYQSP